MERVLTPEAEAFIKEWNSSENYITAYTSGSTGIPKEIRLLKSDMLASARATNRFFSIDSNSLLLLPLSPSYIAGKMQIVRALEANCGLITEAPSNSPFTSYSGEASMMPVVPSQLTAVLESGLYKRVGTIIIGGSPLSPEMEKKLLDLRLNAWVTYGMTETCSHVALRKVGQELYHALPGFTFSVDERGCLNISSSALSFGSLQTNDVVELLSPFEFKWLGRADNVINSGGMKIHPETIERLISSLISPFIEFYIGARESALWGEEAVMVTSASPALLPDSKLDECNALFRKKIIKSIIRVEEIPRTSSGKIRRSRW